MTIPAKPARPKTKILVDGGDPAETLRVKKLIGFVDGQTTNPSLIAKNPEIAQMIASGHKLTDHEETEEYKKIVQEISPLVGSAGVSIEVFSDLDTSADHMFSQGREMNSWIPNAVIKYPCTPEGLKAAKMSCEEGIRINITLCFSQEQAAAVYSATKGAKASVYISPFVGRLDDIGLDGMSLIRNIKKMYEAGDGHVEVLVASVRNLEHLMYSFALQAELATVPTKVLEQWAAQNFPVPEGDYEYKALSASGVPFQEIAYLDLDLNNDWETFDLQHELTEKGIKKFVADYDATLNH